jgi:hypothetical protein
MTHFSQLDGEYFGQEEEIFLPKQSGTKRKVSLGQNKHLSVNTISLSQKYAVGAAT